MFALQDASHVAALPGAFAGLGRDAVGVELVGDLLEAAAGPALARDAADDLLLGIVVHQPIERLAGLGRFAALLQVEAIGRRADEATLIEAAVQRILNPAPDQLALEFGHAGENDEHELAGRPLGAEIVPAHIDDVQGDAHSIELVDRVQEIPGAAAQAIELGHDQMLDLGAMAQGGKKSGAAGAVKDGDAAGGVGIVESGLFGRGQALEGEIIADPLFLGFQRGVLLIGADAAIHRCQAAIKNWIIHAATEAEFSSSHTLKNPCSRRD